MPSTTPVTRMRRALEMTLEGGRQICIPMPIFRPRLCQGQRFMPETQSALIHLSQGKNKNPTERLHIYPGNQRLLAAESDDCGGGDGDSGEEGGGRGQRFGCGGGGWQRRGYLFSGWSGRVGWKRQNFDFLCRHPTWELIPKWEPKGAPFVSLRNFLISLPVPRSGRRKKATFEFLRSDCAAPLSFPYQVRNSSLCLTEKLSHVITSSKIGEGEKGNF